MPLKHKILLITGGTGSFGNAVLSRFLNTDIGDARDYQSILNATRCDDYIFHAAGSAKAGSIMRISSH